IFSRPGSYHKMKCGVIQAEVMNIGNPGLCISGLDVAMTCNTLGRVMAHQTFLASVVQVAFCTAYVFEYLFMQPFILDVVGHALVATLTSLVRHGFEGLLMTGVAFCA